MSKYIVHEKMPRIALLAWDFCFNFVKIQYYYIVKIQYYFSMNLDLFLYA
jgi:hypothetical protein